MVLIFDFLTMAAMNAVEEILSEVTSHNAEQRRSRRSTVQMDFHACNPHCRNHSLRAMPFGALQDSLFAPTGITIHEIGGAGASFGGKAVENRDSIPRRAGDPALMCSGPSGRSATEAKSNT